MLLINANIYTMDSDIILNGFIYIEKEKICSIGQMKNLKIEDNEIIDLKGKNVYPGFIDAHTHLGICESGLTFEGDDTNEYTDPSMPQLQAVDAVNPFDESFKDAISSGITTIITGPGSANPIGGQLVAMDTYGSCIDDMILKNPVAIKFALGENPKSTYFEKHMSPMTRMATASIIREQLNKAKIYNNDKKNAEKDPNQYDMPEYDIKCEALIPLLDKEICAHFHAHRADDIFTAIRISKEFSLNFVIVHATEAHLIAGKLKDYDAKVIVGPLLSDRSKPELANLTTKLPKILSDNKIKMAICTDHPETPVQYLLLSAAVAVRDGLDEYEALKSITINAAEICNIDDLVGSVTPGKYANLVVFSGSPFDIMDKPELVMCRGKCLSNI